MCTHRAAALRCLARARTSGPELCRALPASSLHACPLCTIASRSLRQATLPSAGATSSSGDATIIGLARILSTSGVIMPGAGPSPLPNLGASRFGVLGGVSSFCRDDASSSSADEAEDAGLIRETESSVELCERCRDRKPFRSALHGRFQAGRLLVGLTRDR